MGWRWLVVLAAGCGGGTIEGDPALDGGDDALEDGATDAATSPDTRDTSVDVTDGAVETATSDAGDTGSGDTGSAPDTGVVDTGSSTDAAPDAPAPTADPFFAISPDEATWGDAQATTLRGLGAGTVRFQFCNWPADKAALDAKVEIARKHGLSVLAEINYCTLYAPAAAADRQAYWHASFSDAGNAFSAKFAAAAGEIAAAFKGRVARYEIWNEPDAAPRPKTGWPGTKWPSATNVDWDGACGAYGYGVDYGQADWAICPRQLGVLTTNAFMAIVANDATAKVVAGNVLFHGDDGWVAKEYWKQVEASPAVAWHVTNKGRRPWDEVGIHPYGYPPGGKLEAQVKAFQVLVTAPAKTVLTEYGWHSLSSADPNLYATEADAAKHLEATFPAMKAAGVPLVMWFNYLSAPGLDFGVRRADLSWKPAAKAYCKATAAPKCPAP